MPISRQLFRLLLLLSQEEEDGEGEGDESHRGADGEIDAEVAIGHDDVGEQQQGSADEGGEGVLVADVLRTNDNAREIGDAEADESDGAADAHDARHEDTDHEENAGLRRIREFDLAAEMSIQLVCAKESGGKTGGEEQETEDDVECGDALKTEVGGAPEVVLFQEVARRSIRHDDGAEAADEGAEDDAEGDEARGVETQSDERHEDGADRLTDEGADGQRAPARHRGGGGTKAGGTAEAERIDIAQLVAPKILHLHAADREGDAAEQHVEEVKHLLREEVRGKREGRFSEGSGLSGFSGLSGISGYSGFSGISGFRFSDPSPRISR